MFRTFFWVAWLFIYLLRKLPVYYKVKRLSEQGKTEEWRALLSREIVLWGQRLTKHIKLNLVIEGKENLPKPGETVLYVANHQSYLDIPIVLIGLAAPYPLMAQKDIFKVPLLNLWLKQIGCIKVDRENVRASLKAMNEGEELLKSGSSLIVFPEGTRSKSDEVAPFKLGGIRIASKAGVPVVPMAIEGSFRVLEGNEYKLQPADVRLVILPKVETGNMTREELKEFPEKLREMIVEAKDRRDTPPDHS